ncbi:MAG TPA: SAM-dependent methyltransferase, partial [Cytophagales bacterium]|nr:SAM-dependent methyltransferase [Cytophagales bacterium]
DPKAREEAFLQTDHVRLFGLDYGKRMERAGFRVKEDRYVMEMDPKRVARHAFMDDEIIYFAQKD